jgi:hypothetical protein
MVFNLLVSSQTLARGERQVFIATVTEEIKSEVVVFLFCHVSCMCRLELTMIRLTSKDVHPESLTDAQAHVYL